MKFKSLLLIAATTIGLNAATMAQTVPTYIPTNGLVGWWPFNGNSNDESGSNNNGTVNGASLTSDRFGDVNKAYAFDGLDDKITSPIINPLQGNWSVSFWFNSSNSSSNFQAQNIIGLGSDIYGWGGAGFQISGQIPPGQCPSFNYLNQMYMFDASQECGGNYVEGGFYSNSEWNNVVIIKNNLNYDLIVNNVLISTSVLLDIDINLLIFGNRDVSFQYFNGKVDDIGAWNRALTQQEVTDLYNANICYQTITVTDTLLINTGIITYNPVIYNNTIKIFPNPTNDHITIDYGNFANMNGYQLRIENSLGQEVFQTSITQQSDYLNLNSWSGNGLYFVHILDPQGNTIDIRKIVLQ